MLLPQDYRTLLEQIATAMERMSVALEIPQAILDRTYLAQLGIESDDQAGELYDVIATCIAAYLAAPERLQVALWTAAVFWSDPEKRASPNFHSAMYWSTWKPALQELKDTHEPLGSGHDVCPN